MVAPPVSLLEGVADIDRNINADFVHQPQRAHWHAPLHKRAVNLLRFQATFEKLSSIEQIRKQNPVHQKTRIVAHNYRQFSDLSHKGQATVARLLRGFLRNHNFHQFHPAHWIEKMQPDHVLGRNGHIGQFADGKR